MGEPVLCYVEGNWAFFTTQQLEKQWGDDWNDAPYQHNAGRPYGPHKENEKWEIIKVAWDGDFYVPADFGNFTVDQINNGIVAWLSTAQYKDAKPIAIPAGTTLSDFNKLIKMGGGNVYTKE